jgi:hypothetical protein
MSIETLHVVTCVANPLRWVSRDSLARAAVASWLKAPQVHVTLVEAAYGARGFALRDLAGARVSHVGVRATTMAWSKECLLNIGASRLPDGVEKIAFLDADVHFRRPQWAQEALAALDLYPVIQPWDTAYDLGPHDEHIQAHVSFASLWHAGKPVTAAGPKFWKFNGGPYDYAHSGYAWGWQRRALDRVGGLFELGGMGSGDHHMALGMVGKPEASLPGGVSRAYRDAVFAWSGRAQVEINGKLGLSHGTIEHPFHGRKNDRAYESRWDMFVQHGFDPHVDLKRNGYGVLEFAGNKPDLERAFDRYLRAREEDVNTLS